jgi:hypothetical protein
MSHNGIYYDQEGRKDLEVSPIRDDNTTTHLETERTEKKKASKPKNLNKHKVND